MNNIRTYIIEKLRLGKNYKCDINITWSDLVSEYNLKKVSSIGDENDEYQVSYLQPEEIINKVKKIADNWETNYNILKEYFETISIDDIKFETTNNKIKNISLFLYKEYDGCKQYIGMMLISQKDNEVSITSHKKEVTNLLAKIYKFIVDELT